MQSLRSANLFIIFKIKQDYYRSGMKVLLYLFIICDKIDIEIIRECHYCQLHNTFLSSSLV